MKMNRIAGSVSLLVLTGLAAAGPCQAAPSRILKFEVVPTVFFVQDGARLKQRYEALGGKMVLIVKKGFKHHPHGLDDPTPVVEFVLKAVARKP